MANKKIGELIAGWLEEFGRENGYELARTEYVKEGGTRYLRVYVDRLENGDYGVMSTDDCEFVSRYLSDKLDEADPIKENYVLEVSSPGLDRPLITEKDFKRFMGSDVEVKLYEPLDGSKLLAGTLAGYKDGEITIKDYSEKEIILQKEKVAKINLAVIF